MDNKTQSFQFRKTKLALAVAMTVGLAACGVDGDEGSVSTSNSQTDASQPTQVEVSMPKGSIQGVVLDTNGHPVVGATVTVAGQTATTDASGSYLFDGVQVTNVAGADAPTGHAAFVVVIQAPEGYASTATVNVTPNAQVDATNGNNNTGDSAGDSVGAPLTTFIDGFLAQAGTAIMPKKGSVIEGWIRSDITGEATVGAEVSLDFTGLSAATVVAGGANVALSGDFAKTMTDANGYYRFEGVYDDSVYNLSIEDYTFATTGSTTTTTTASVAAVESYTAAANANTVATANTATALTQVLVNGADQTANFQLVGGQIIAANGANLITAADFVIVKYNYAVTTTTTTTATAGGGQTSGSTPATTAEGVDINMGTLTVRPITSADTISPYITNVTGWIQSSSGGYGILNEGVNKTFTIQFSEPVNKTTFNVAEMLVTDSSSNILAVEAENGIVLAEDGRSVTINLAEEQEAGTKLSVFIPWQDATDVAGNFFSTTANDTMNIDFDSRINAASGKASYLRVNLCVFLPAIITPEGYAAVQDFDWSSSVDADSADLAAYSNAFWDNHDGGTDTEIRQLNGQPDTAVFLKALADEIDGTYTVDNNHAWVDVTLGTASGYTYTGGTGTSTSGNVWFDGVSHGSKKTFTFLNDLSLAAGSVTVTLVDGVKPTTTLQENYTLPGVGIYASKIVTTGAIATQGAGGEVTEIGEAATIGNPIIYVQPRHLTPTNPANNTALRGDEFDNLTDDMSGRGDSTTVATPSSIQDSAAGANPIFTGAAQPIYDDAAFAAWTAADRANSLGVSFVEDIEMVAGQTPIFSGDDAVLSNYSALNDVSNNIDGAANTNNNDLVRVLVSDMVALANDDHNETIAFSGDVQDIFGNVADDNSRATVVLRDAMPPMVTSASYNGADVTIVFNEALGSRSALHNKAITIDDFVSGAAEQPVTITLNQSSTGSTAGAFSLSADSKTLTVQLGANSAAVSNLFDNATAEFQWNEVGTATSENHASLAWDTIPDARGNQWSFFDTDTVGTAARDNRYEVEAPRFYIFDNVGPFQYTVATAGYADGGVGGDDDGNITFTITFTHPISLALGNAFSNAIDGADGIATPDPITNLSYSTATTGGRDVLNALFSVDVDGDNTADRVFDTGVPTDGTEVAGSMTISNGNTTITLVIDGAVEEFVHPTAKFGFKTTVTSAINGNVTTAGTFNWQNTN